MRISKNHAKLRVEHDDPAGKQGERPVIIRVGAGFDLFATLDEAESLRDDLSLTLAAWGR